ncbi:MAG: hypothetical protein GX811_04170 [Lentisphaerae bacterium]|nr:hypothetical protein [Lentisphaerota bacterium]
MRDTKWFSDCGWGVFCHYLTSPDTSADEWNRQIDAFDTDRLAKQLASVNAPYFYITLGQGSGHYCLPNETYDSIVGINPSKCAKRDLIADLYDSLTAYGIHLMIYIPADGSWADHEARAKLKLTMHWTDDPKFNWRPGEHWAKFRLPEFQQIWEEISLDWAERFGKKIKGWWVDGTFAAEYRYPEDEVPNFRTYADVLRTGNPDALIAFNPGVRIPVIHYTDYEDYTAGELSISLPECRAGFVKRRESGHEALYHVLTYLGRTWGKDEMRFPDELAVGYTKHVVEKGGVVSWDVPIEKSGEIKEVFLEQLAKVSTGIKEMRQA